MSLLPALTGDATPPTVAARPAAERADPSRDLRAGAIIAALFFVGGLGWAAIARLDAAATAPGALVVTGQRQSVQHRDGGVVGEILVKEGERVRTGQPLIRLAAVEVAAQERAFASAAITLMAQRSRLIAEQTGARSIAVPPEFATLPDRDRADAVSAMRLQQRELNARAAVLSAQKAALGQRGVQSDQQGVGYGAQASATAEQLRIVEDQIESLRPLAAQGYVSQSRMRDLERYRAELRGSRGQQQAAVAQARAATGESRLQALQLDRARAESIAAEMREVDSRLGEILPKLAAARDQLQRTELRAPATGSVVGLSVFTPGGVVAAGQKLMDIVPEREPLRIQARVSPNDADDLTIGQRTTIRFDGLHDRALPTLEGQLTRLSADAFTDERTGESYFTADVTVPDSQVVAIQRERGPRFQLRAGMPVSVMFPLRRRTVLDYIIEPLIGSFWTAGREH